MPTCTPKALPVLTRAIHLTTLLFSLTTATKLPPQTETDIIIIGGGTAGLTLANRLSASPYLTIAVIEPGHDEGNNPNVTNVDWLAGPNALNTHVDWVYQTTGQRFADGRRIQYHAGRAWGGTSAINGSYFTSLYWSIPILHDLNRCLV